MLTAIVRSLCVSLSICVCVGNHSFTYSLIRSVPSVRPPARPFMGSTGQAVLHAGGEGGEEGKERSCTYYKAAVRRGRPCFRKDRVGLCAALLFCVALLNSPTRASGGELFRQEEGHRLARTTEEGRDGDDAYARHRIERGPYGWQIPSEPRGIHVWSPGMSSSKRTYDKDRDSPFAPPYHGNCNGVDCHSGTSTLSQRGYIRDPAHPRERKYLTLHDTSGRARITQPVPAPGEECADCKNNGYPGVTVENAANSVAPLSTRTQAPSTNATGKDGRGGKGKGTGAGNPEDDDGKVNPEDDDGKVNPEDDDDKKKSSPDGGDKGKPPAGMFPKKNAPGGMFPKKNAPGGMFAKGGPSAAAGMFSKEGGGGRPPGRRPGSPCLPTVRSLPT